VHRKSCTVRHNSGGTIILIEQQVAGALQECPATPAVLPAEARLAQAVLPAEARSAQAGSRNHPPTQL
jgi:hypothetical protein